VLIFKRELNFQIYESTTLFENIPNWLAFLKENTLIDDELLDLTFSELQPLAKQFGDVLAMHRADPALEKSIGDVWGVSSTASP
jgi:hypothetical protein